MLICVSTVQKQFFLFLSKITQLELHLETQPELQEWRYIVTHL